MLTSTLVHSSGDWIARMCKPFKLSRTIQHCCWGSWVFAGRLQMQTALHLLTQYLSFGKDHNWNDCRAWGRFKETQSSYSSQGSCLRSDFLFWGPAHIKATPTVSLADLLYSGPTNPNKVSCFWAKQATSDIRAGTNPSCMHQLCAAEEFILLCLWAAVQTVFPIFHFTFCSSFFPLLERIMLLSHIWAQCQEIQKCVHF